MEKQIQKVVDFVLDRKIPHGLGGIFTESPLEIVRAMSRILSRGSSEFHVETVRNLTGKEQTEQTLNRLLASGNCTIRSLMERPDAVLQNTLQTIPTSMRQDATSDIFFNLTNKGLADYLSQHPEDLDALYEEALHNLPVNERDWVFETPNEEGDPDFHKKEMIASYVNIAMPLKEFLNALNAQYNDEI